MTTTASTPSKFKPYTRQSIVTARQWEWLTPELQEAVQVVSHVLPFRTNAYVMDELRCTVNSGHPCFKQPVPFC